jgi:putative tricarboxylic transport membrane protein
MTGQHSQGPGHNAALRIKSERDFWSGILFLGTGIGFALGATQYSMGSAARPGPGYFPLLLSCLLAILGTIFLGCLVGTLIGVLPGVGRSPPSPCCCRSPSPRPDRRADHAGRHLLRRPVRRLDDRDPGQHPRRGQSVVTAIDGHQMAKQGRAGVALGTAAIGSFFAGTVATMVIAALGPPLTGARVAVRPGGVFLADGAGPDRSRWCWPRLGAEGHRDDRPRAAARPSAPTSKTGEERLTLGIAALADGIDFRRARHGHVRLRRDPAQPREPRGPRRRARQDRPACCRARGQDLQADASAPILRGTGLGSLLGILPGNGAVLARSPPTRREEDRQGSLALRQGRDRGRRRPEAANNAGAQTAFIPMLTLGIPPNAVMALMVGAMIIQGIIPGPQVMTKQPRTCSGA